MISREKENPADGPGAMKKAKHESKFLSLLEDVLDKLDTTDMQILVLNMLRTRKYRNTFVLMLTERTIPLGGGKITVHSYLYSPLWHENTCAYPEHWYPLNVLLLQQGIL